MPGFVQVVITGDFAKTEAQLDALRHRLSDLTDLNEEIGAYLVSSTRNRIYSTKKAPDGTPWAADSELTVALKGNGSVLYDTGELASSLRVSDADRGGVTVVADAPYAGYVQNGRSKTRGWIGTNKITARRPFEIKSDQPVPARPFMGISAENKRRIAKMVKDHIAQSTVDDDWGFGG